MRNHEIVTKKKLITWIQRRNRLKKKSIKKKSIEKKLIGTRARLLTDDFDAREVVSVGRL